MPFMPSHYYGLNCVPLAGSSVEALTPSVTTFGGGASTEVIKVTGGHKCGAFIQYVCVLIKRGREPRAPSLSPSASSGGCPSVCVCLCLHSSSYKAVSSIGLGPMHIALF